MSKKLTKIINGEVCEIARWTSSCTGCFESEDGNPVGEYSYDHKAMCHVGAGCRECGHTGKRRIEMWVPVFVSDDEKPTGSGV